MIGGIGLNPSIQNYKEWDCRAEFTLNVCEGLAMTAYEGTNYYMHF